ncbi:MAG: alpha/beta fold hydrolase [Alphaproteobacteria bacterium]
MSDGPSGAMPAPAPTRRIEIDGLSLAVVDHRLDPPAPGPPMLLLHGGMAHARWFDPLGPMLASFGHPYAFDRRGHGESEWTDRDRYGWQRDLADVTEAMRLLDPRPWVLVGHSQGGLLAADLASRREGSLAGLVLLDIPLFLGTPAMRSAGDRLSRIPQMRWPTLETAVAGFRPYPLPHRIPADRLAALAASSFKPDGEGGFTSRFHWKVFRADPGGGPGKGFADRLREIGVPTLCLRGEASTILSAGDHEEMLRRIPRSTGSVVPGATHHLHVEQPRVVADAIAAFVGELPRD